MVDIKRLLIGAGAVSGMLLLLWKLLDPEIQEERVAFYTPNFEIALYLVNGVLQSITVESFLFPYMGFSKCSEA